MTPAQRARLDIREKRHTGTTRGLAFGYVQCNLAVVPEKLAFELLLYCQRNARACPVLEICDPGSPEPRQLAPGADLRTDLPRYAVYRNGERLPDVKVPDSTLEQKPPGKPGRFFMPVARCGKPLPRAKVFRCALCYNGDRTSGRISGCCAY